MEQLNKVNQYNKLLKKTHKNKAQQNQVLVTKGAQQIQTSAPKSMTPTNDTGTKPNKIEKHSSKDQPAVGNKITQTKVQAILASHVAEYETDSDLEEERDQEQLDIDVLINVGSNNE